MSTSTKKGLASLGPRILCYDLETAGVNAFNADLSNIVCFGYKWVGVGKAEVLTINQYPGWFSRENGLNDRPLLVHALDIMDEADIIVAHYGDRFDKPFLAGRAVIHGLKPPPAAKQRDTWDIARKAFKFSSNRLVNLANIFQLPNKKMAKKVPEHWPGWWLKAMAGNETAIEEMAAYCAQDVKTLEQVYLRLRPYDTAHPRVVEDRAKCPLCGSRVEYRGWAVTRTKRYRRFQCVECGHWGRDTKGVK